MLRNKQRIEVYTFLICKMKCSIINNMCEKEVFIIYIHKINDLINKKMKETLMFLFDGKVKHILPKIVYHILQIKSELIFLKKMSKTQEKISKSLEIFINIFLNICN